MGTTTPVFVGLGGNQPSTDDAFRRARQNLEKQFGTLRTSSLLTTEPHATDAQGPFLNQVVEFRVPSPDPEDILKSLLSLENTIGRERDGTPDRLIDMDLLYVGQTVVRSMELRVPHPRIHRRSFVLRSMVERAPQFVHPVLRRTQRQLLDRIRS